MMTDCDIKDENSKQLLCCLHKFDLYKCGDLRPC